MPVSASREPRCPECDEPKDRPVVGEKIRTRCFNRFHSSREPGVKSLMVCLNCGIVLDPPLFDREKVALPCSHLRTAQVIEVGEAERRVRDRTAEIVNWLRNNRGDGRPFEYAADEIEREFESRFVRADGKESR